MNYQSFGKELTLISKKYLEFFIKTLIESWNTTWSKVSTMSVKRFFLIIDFPHLDYQSLTNNHLKVFELPEEYQMR